MDKARRVLVVLVAAVCLLPPSVRARVWFVRSDGTGDAPTIQAAIDSAAAGDTITLATGTFDVHEIIGWGGKDNITINSEAGSDSTRLNMSENGLMMVGGCSEISIQGILFANSKGIALSVWGASLIDVSSCSFFNNGHYWGKYAVVFRECDGIQLHDCNISGNRAGVDYYESNSNILNYNNTFIANIGAAVDLNDVMNCEIRNSLICSNEWGILGLGIAINLSCNNVFNNGGNYNIFRFPDPTGLNGNISVDPQFCSIDPVAYSNYFLQSDSPCAPGNHPDGYACGLIGCKPAGCSTVGTEKSEWSKLKQLLK